jgi:Na+/H+ antiporter NhaD/arsenite permease-like protein
LDGHIRYKGFRFDGVILADAYCYSKDSTWKTALPVHTVVATVFATVAAAFQHFWERRSRRERNLTCKTYSLGSMLLLTAVVATIFGLLSCVGAPPVLYGCILVVLSGQFITVMTVGWLDRG